MGIGYHFVGVDHARFSFSVHQLYSNHENGIAYDQWTDLLFWYGLNDRIEVVGVMKNYSETGLG